MIMISRALKEAAAVINESPSALQVGDYEGDDDDEDDDDEDDDDEEEDDENVGDYEDVMMMMRLRRGDTLIGRGSSDINNQ